MTKRPLNKFYYCKFYDHCEGTDKDDDPVTIEIWKGRLEKEDDLYYYFNIVNCSLGGNSTIWKVMKSVVITLRRFR